MNARFLQGMKGAAVLITITVIVGCFDQTGRTSSATNIATPALAAAPLPTALDSPSDSPDAAPADAAPAAPPKLPDAPPAKVVAPAMPELSPGLADVIKLAQSQVGEDVLIAYVEKSAAAFNPSVEEILYLHDLGIPEPVISAIVKKSKGTAGVNAPAKPVMAAAPVPQPDPNVPVAPVQNAPLAPEPAAQVTYNYFYNELRPYGDWVQVADYGWCWRPTVATLNLSWQPYNDRGRWVWSDRGWYWQSDYSWGATAFHYGRWYRHAYCGWIWVPDTCWGPSWVTWRYSNDYCGWAPLPPGCAYTSAGFTYWGSRVGVSFGFGLDFNCYTFVPFGSFCEPNIRRHCLDTRTIVKIYNNTTIINNVRGNHNTVINDGIGRDRVVHATGHELHTAHIRDMDNDMKTGGIRPDHVVRTSDESGPVIFRGHVPGVNSTRGPAGGAVAGNVSTRQPGAAPEPTKPVMVHPLVNARLDRGDLPNPNIRQDAAPLGNGGSRSGLTRRVGTEGENATGNPRTGQNENLLQNEISKRRIVMLGENNPENNQNTPRQNEPVRQPNNPRQNFNEPAPQSQQPTVVMPAPGSPVRGTTRFGSTFTTRQPDNDGNDNTPRNNPVGPSIRNQPFFQAPSQNVGPAPSRDRDNSPGPSRDVSPGPSRDYSSPGPSRSYSAPSPAPQYNNAPSHSFSPAQSPSGGGGGGGHISGGNSGGGGGDRSGGGGGGGRGKDR